MNRRVLAFAVVLLSISAATPSQAADVEDGTVLAGVSVGIGAPQGGAGQALGEASLIGGQLIDHPIGEWGVGLQVDRFEFKPKGETDADMTSIFGVVRGNVSGLSDKNLPYVLFGLGYAESNASVAGGGTDRGSGPGFELGMGFDRFITQRVSIAIEARLSRLAAPIPHAGLGGATVAGISFRLNCWLGP